MPEPIVATPAAPIPGAPAAAPVPAALKPAVSPAPAQIVQPSPVVKPGAAPAVPAAAPGSVPLSALMEEREKRQALQSEMEQLRTTVQQIQQRQNPAPGMQQQAAPQPDMKAELDKLWQSDPRKAVQTEIMMATQWMDNVNAQVDGEAEGLAAKYKDFNDYRNTAMRYVRALPLDQRARPGIVEMAYLVTRGQNVDQIMENQRATMAQQFQNNPAAFQMPAGAGAAPIVPTGTVATEGQIRAAQAMRIPIDQYMKHVK